VQRIRLTFEKGAPLRFIGHLDLARMWERAFRRAKLPLAYTQGYTPHPRLTFAAPLALGATGSGELVDVYLREMLPIHEVLERVRAQLPAGCAVSAAAEVPLQDPAATALVRWAMYQIEVSAAAHDTGNVGKEPGAIAPPVQGSRWSRATNTELESGIEAPDESEPDQMPWRPTGERLAPPAAEPQLPDTSEITNRIAALLAAKALPRQRVRDGRTVPYDLRPLVLDVWIGDAGARDGLGGSARLSMLLRLDAAGAGRPEEVAAALGLRARTIHRERLGLEGDVATRPKA